MVHTTFSSKKHRQAILPRPEDEYCLTKLDTISVLQWVGLMLVNELSVDLGTVGASFIPQHIVAISMIIDRGVRARNSKILKDAGIEPQ